MPQMIRRNLNLPTEQIQKAACALSWIFKLYIEMIKIRFGSLQSLQSQRQDCIVAEWDENEEDAAEYDGNDFFYED